MKSTVSYPQECNEDIVHCYNPPPYSIKIRFPTPYHSFLGPYISFPSPFYPFSQSYNQFPEAYNPFPSLFISFPGLYKSFLSPFYPFLRSYNQFPELYNPFLSLYNSFPGLYNTFPANREEHSTPLLYFFIRKTFRNRINLGCYWRISKSKEIFAPGSTRNV